MSHPNQITFCNTIKYMFPQYFVGKRVLDVGSLDVNGNSRNLFEDCEYVGLDVVEGENVDVVSMAHEYRDEEGFDVVLSMNALEHDMHYAASLVNMISLLKPNGLMFFSVANGWKEHGTTTHDPQLSGTTQLPTVWKDYYKNLSEGDIDEVVNIDSEFLFWRMGVNKLDLQFYGVKQKGLGEELLQAHVDLHKAKVAALIESL